MPKYQVAARFATTVMHRGTNVHVVGIEGKLLDLDPDIAQLVNQDCGIAVLALPTAKQDRQVKKAVKKQTRKGG